MSDTIFDKIVSGEISSYKIWENETHLAFLTPFPNTPGASVVIPKKNLGSYVFSFEVGEYLALMEASRNVANLLKKSLGVTRVAMVIEGTGVAYAHVKLYPLHGKLAEKTDIFSDQTTFTEDYLGYLTTVEGPPMNAGRLQEIQKQIRDSS
jgi:diadenosine tetraphosphate (Ap4A) HIT family hydrolase